MRFILYYPIPNREDKKKTLSDKFSINIEQVVFVGNGETLYIIRLRRNLDTSFQKYFLGCIYFGMGKKIQLLGREVSEL